MAAKNTCADCRHFTRASGWCAVYTKRVSRFAARCDYGALCIRAEKLPKERVNITAEVLPKNWRVK